MVARIWAKGARVGRETRFFVIFSSLGHQFSLKSHTKILVQIWAKQAKIKPEISFFFLPFSKFGSLVFLEIACNASLQ